VRESILAATPTGVLFRVDHCELKPCFPAPEYRLGPANTKVTYGDTRDFFRLQLLWRACVGAARVLGEKRRETAWAVPFFCDQFDAYVGHVAHLRRAAAVEFLQVDLLLVRAVGGLRAGFARRFCQQFRTGLAGEELPVADDDE
jgi:hypothetical protein